MTSAHAPLQFGTPEPAVVYRDRPAAFAVVDRDGRIATVRVTKDGTSWFDLPGGAIDPGEDEKQAVVREFGEETALVVKAGAVITRADQFMRKTDGDPVNNRSTIFRAEVTGKDAALKIEEDHELVWLAPEQALTRLRHDSHAWAVLAWMRALDRGGAPD